MFARMLDGLGKQLCYFSTDNVPISVTGYERRTRVYLVQMIARTHAHKRGLIVTYGHSAAHTVLGLVDAVCNLKLVADCAAA